MKCRKMKHYLIKIRQNSTYKINCKNENKINSSINSINNNNNGMIMMIFNTRSFRKLVSAFGRKKKKKEGSRDTHRENINKQ